MSMDIGVYQQANLSQQLNLAPQLLQWLKLLQAPTTELSALVRHELESNPALELEDPAASLADPDEEAGAVDESAVNDLAERLEMLAGLDDDWRHDAATARGLNAGSVEDEQEKHQYLLDSAKSPESLQDHLLHQVSCLHLNEVDGLLAELIVGSLDENGYLSVPLVELAAMAGAVPGQAERVLAMVQDLDPAGIAARDLKECLLLQLRGEWDENSLPVRLLRDYSELLAALQYGAIAVNVGVTEAEVRQAAQVLGTLNPKPGRLFHTTPVAYVEPDARVDLRAGQITVDLNDHTIPHLRLSAECRKLLDEARVAGEDKNYLRRKLRAASFLIQGISQRQDTLLRVVQEIVRVQEDFFRNPGAEIKPLTMVKVASVLDVHETTISRAIANKYLQTPRGIFEMKHFFRAGYQCNDGSTVTPDGVKDTIADMIRTENPRVPLTDLQMVDLLKQKGLRIARRTVAKYRDELGVPSSKDRACFAKNRNLLGLDSAKVIPEVEEAAACAG